MARMFTEKEAEIFGKRKVCASEGHDIRSALAEYGWEGGVQMQYERGPQDVKASCDTLSCSRCDAKFEVTYPEIGTKQ